MDSEEATEVEKAGFPVVLLEKGHEPHDVSDAVGNYLSKTDVVETEYLSNEGVQWQPKAGFELVLINGAIHGKDGTSTASPLLRPARPAGVPSRDVK